ncbi:MAG: oxidoreductase [Gammaproteobacteria bacterium]|nr:oxidoreductase [Gammaproteobacteria bacterium]MBU1415918.1 oxidoreductase [Gammaproteobacteria bacterium]
MTGADWDPKLVAGLRALAEASFPKRCIRCGAVYEDVQDYVQRTAAVSSIHSGLKQSGDDDVRTIMELFRTCACGSTLMDLFRDRRDESGAARRRCFAELLAYLADAGLDDAVARAELFKVMRGEDSETLARIRSPRKT